MRAIDLDPTGEHHGIPTFPWKFGPEKERMATRRQLRAMGLRPGGQPVAAQVVCRGGTRVGHLYPVAGAKPVRSVTPAMRAALDKAMKARMTCPVCRVTYDFCLPLKSLGSCLPCSELSDEEREQLAALAA
ncbi:RRQRL motif-containing zinc-binding protein [Kitasatospora sp. NPDC053057]|uniref:RRQRL motif-containing zinc-binding protein n=1 Tax=Kitasatospora sp. NPDC053057 TaxID=3364062 RepID=UPI0037CBAB18